MENSKGQNQRNQNTPQEPMRNDQSGSGQSDLSEDRGRQNASSNRGGTTDLDRDALTTDRGNQSRRGSGAVTKNNVTGSDFDGQVSGE
jgi:hypothetical protein